MAVTDNLNITEVPTNSTSKEATWNTAINALDNATQKPLAVTFASNLRTLTQAEFTRNVAFAPSATFTAQGTLTVPLSNRVFYVDNSINPTYACVVEGATGGAVTVPAGVLAEVHCDGTKCVAPTPLTAVGVATVNGRSGVVTLGVSDILAINAGKLVGNPGTAAAAGSEITVGVGLALSPGGTLSSTALGEALYWAGTWNATTNTPTLTSGTGTAGALYTVATAGTTTVDGISSWDVGDKIAFDGVAAVWRKIDGHATEVASVAGRTGAVTLTGADIGLNLGAVVYTAGDLLVANGSSYASVPLSGDAAINAGGTLTLGSVVAAGTVGSSSGIPVITYDAKGRIISATTAAVSGAGVTSVNTRTGVVTLGVSDILAVNAGRIIGNSGTAAAPGSEIAVGGGLILAGGTLSAPALGLGISNTGGTLNVQNRGTITLVGATTGTITPGTTLTSALVNVGTASGTINVGLGSPGQAFRLDILMGATAHGVSFVNTSTGTDIIGYTPGTTAAKMDHVGLITNDGTTWHIVSVAHGY